MQIFHKLFIVLVLLLVGNKLFSGPLPNEEKWKKTYAKLLDRSIDNADSCEKAALVFLQELNQSKANNSWKSKAYAILSRSQYNNGKSNEAIESAKTCIELQENTNEADVLGYAYYYYSNALYQQKKYEECIQPFLNAISNLGMAKNSWLEANARFLLGYTYYYLKDFKKAQVQYKESATLFEGYVSTKVLGDVYYFWAEMENFDLENYQVASDLYAKSAKVYDDVKLTAEAAYDYFKVGEMNKIFLNNPEVALDGYLKSIDHYTADNNFERVAKINKAIGDLYVRLHEYDKAVPYYKKAATFYEEKKETINEGNCYLEIGDIYYFAGRNPEALSYYRKSLTVYENANSLDGQAGAYIGLGNFYQRRGDPKKGIEMFEKSIDFYSKMEKVSYGGISSGLIGLGNCYYDLGDQEKALEYYLKALENESKTSNVDNTVSYINIANIYSNRKDSLNFLKFITLAISEAEKNNDLRGKASSLSSRGYHYIRSNNPELAFEDCSAALEINKKLGFLPAIAESYKCLYFAAYDTKNYKDALDYYYYYIANRDSVNNEKRNTEINKRELEYEYEKKQTLLKMEEERKQFALKEELNRKQLYYDMEKERMQMRSAAEKREIELKEDFKRKQLAGQYKEKQRLAELEQQKKDLAYKQSIAEEELKTKEQKRLNQWLFIGLSILGILLFVILKGYRDKQKANKLILQQKKETEEQKELVELKSLQLEEKNREILDSITYARRLQEAILPPQKLVKQYLTDSFILYKPRDIVAGDFYWMETVSNGPNSSDQLVLFAVADCTGHGVPGAMVSVVCSGALNRAVKEFQLKMPGKILDKVRELVLETFEKSESEVKDGMDISLCAVDFEKRKLYWSGANNPVWILNAIEAKKSKLSFEELTAQQIDLSQYGLREFKADKQPIGATENPKPFTTHEIDLLEGDVIYMSSDGFADQFGGAKGKKFKDSNLKKLLITLSDKDLSEQTKHINAAFEEWRGNLEQVDDVCLIGVRVA